MSKLLASVTGFLLLSSIALAEVTEITQIEMKRDRGYDYLDVYTTGWSEARGLLLEDKLYIDFPEPCREKDKNFEKNIQTHQEYRGYTEG